MSLVLLFTVCCAWICVIGYLVFGAEDVLLDISLIKFFRQRKSSQPLTIADLKQRKEQHIAIFVPAWQEAGIVDRMAGYAAQTLEYAAYDIFIGVYPNDLETCRHVDAIAKDYSHVHRVTNTRPGPTSKADCLNVMYEGMKAREKEISIRYSIIAIHDAEDVLHPQTLRMYNYHVPDLLDMAQLPVFPLEEKPWRSWVRNTYLDEFCESHLKDMTIRQAVGGVVPSAGVGTAFKRDSLDELAVLNEGYPFQADSLTEDYRVGLEFSRMNKRTGFLNQPIVIGENAEPGEACDNIVSVREFFPDSFWASVRQRARWTMGIVFQSWAQCGWFGSLAQRYTLYRDRRAPLVHAINLIGYTLPAYMIAHWLALSLGWADETSFPSLFSGRPWLWKLTMVAMALLLYRFAVKAFFVHLIYGWQHALFCFLRYPVANVVNFFAVFRAMFLYIEHKLTGRPLAWNKTTHQFPTASRLQQQFGHSRTQ